MSAAAPAAGRRHGRLTIESLVIGALVLFGYRAGLKGISDNSAFVHIRTGIEMITHGSIPRSDPYSFTAPGHPWVVQSWLASAVYGLAYHVSGLHLLVIVNGLIGAALAWTLARLARTGSGLRTMVAAPLAVIGGAIYWAPRPLMFGLLCLALLITVVERRASVWWLVPITWVWVNTHGSFPLGLAWLAARAVGEAIDAKAWPRWMGRYLLGFVASLGIAAINPLGPKLLAFPFAVRDKMSVFRNVVEWRSPDFQSTDGLFTLALVALILIVLLRGRLKWSDVLPVVGFLALGLISVRNISPAIVVFAPALGHAMTASGRSGDLRAEEPIGEEGPPRQPPDPPQPDPPGSPDRSLVTTGAPRLNAVLAVVLVLAAAIFTLGSERTSPLALRTYPTEAEAFMVAHGELNAPHRVAAQDVVGCYLVLIRGLHTRVFIDDRVDMYPVSISNDYDSLLHGSTSSVAILDKYQIDTVLWDRHLALIALLQAAGGWRMVYPTPTNPSDKSGDKRWIVLVRDRTVLPGQFS